MEITIFTPTYNREYFLKRLYKSLIRQKFKSFEWIIVDDGSTDNSSELIEGFIKEKKIEIKYFKQNNAGKYKAINKGIDKAEGELFFIVDSDDYLLDDALFKIKKWYENIRGDKGFIGIAGLRAYENREIIGTIYGKEYVDATVLKYRYELKVKGDKAEVFVTELLKKYKFPIINDSEKFQTEAIIFNKMGEDGYKIRWYNDPIYITEYLEGGLTANSEERRKNNWDGYTYYYNEIIKYSIPFKSKLIELSNYFRFGLNFKKSKELLRNIKGNKLLIMSSFSIGKVYNIKDKLK